MISNSIFSALPARGAALFFAAALAGCSTVEDISPFTSNVPYAQNIKPNLPQPAVVEIPAFKPKPQPKPTPAVATAPAASTAPAAPPPPAPATAPPPEAPPAVQPTPPPVAASTPPASAAPAAAAQPAPAAPAAPSPSPAAPAQAAPPSPGSQSSAAQPAPKTTASASPAGNDTDQTADSDLPTIPAERRAFNDDGVYPNLARVPARPVNMPTFGEAAALEKSLKSDEAAAKDARPASPAAPSPDSAPAPADPKLALASAPKPEAPVAPRLEDRSPCLGPASGGGSPVLTLKFAPGSAALSADDMATLADALATVRSINGTIRVFGHGDTDAGSPLGAARFDLATARAGAVAQALAGYGIPMDRVAVGVACMDAAVSGASVQLYAES